MLDPRQGAEGRVQRSGENGWGQGLWQGLWPERVCRQLPVWLFAAHSCLGVTTSGGSSPLIDAHADGVLIQIVLYARDVRGRPRRLALEHLTYAVVGLRHIRQLDVGRAVRRPLPALVPARSQQRNNSTRSKSKVPLRPERPGIDTCATGATQWKSAI